MNINRNEEGVVNINGQTTIKVPKNRSALGILASKSGIVCNGDYREDGWIYVDDKPVRKWFVRHEGIEVWEPKLKDPVKLYKSYRRILDKVNEEWTQLREVLHELWNKNSTSDDSEVVAHASVLDDSEKCFEYSIRKYNNQLSYGYEWIDIPKRFKNKKLGDKLYRLNRRHSVIHNRAWKFRLCFYESIMNTLPPAKEDQILFLKFGDTAYTIKSQTNDRIHWWWSGVDDTQYDVKTIKML